MTVELIGMRQRFMRLMDQHTRDADVELTRLSEELTRKVPDWARSNQIWQSWCNEYDAAQAGENDGV